LVIDRFRVFSFFKIIKGNKMECAELLQEMVAELKIANEKNDNLLTVISVMQGDIEKLKEALLGAENG